MRICIWCLERKPVSAFNVEHVIPQTFGSFENNIVLDCVCIDCNDYFGRTIDLKQARDSVEGMDRYWSGMKPTSEFKSLGHRSTTRVRFADGATQGREGYAVANPENGELRVFAFPQVGIQQDDQPIRWFLKEELPEKSALPGHGIEPKRPFLLHVREMTSEDGKALLASKGYVTNNPVEVQEPPKGDIIEVVTYGTIGRSEKREATKIALNYLASQVGSAPVRDVAFNEVREFARHNRGQSRVHISKNPWHIARNEAGRPPARGHYLSVHTSPDGYVTAQLSLMLRLRYIVHLMSVPFVTGRLRVRAAHFFDIDAHVVRPVAVPKLVPGELLPTTDDDT